MIIIGPNATPDELVFSTRGRAIEIYEHAVIKDLHTNEVDNYIFLNRSLEEMEKGVVKVEIPRIIDIDHKENKLTLSRLTKFPLNVGMDFIFGRDSNLEHDKNILLALFELKKIRVEDSQFLNSEIPDGNLDETLRFVKAQLTETTAIYWDEIYAIFNATHRIITEAQVAYAHRDASRRNIAVSYFDNSVVQMLDLETAGLAYVGYDEGRFLTYCCLNRDGVENVVRIFYNQYTELPERLNFWRTAIVRCLREIKFINETQVYEDNLNISYPNEEARNFFKEELNSALIGLLNLSIVNIQNLLEN